MPDQNSDSMTDLKNTCVQNIKTFIFKNQSEGSNEVVMVTALDMVDAYHKLVKFVGDPSRFASIL